MARRDPLAITVLAFAAFALIAGSAWAATINGTARGETLRGTTAADRIDGKGGHDKLIGAGGNDVLVGGPGNDILVGGAGADTLRCGPGRDTATRDKRDKVASDCEVVRGPAPDSPAPPPTPPPPPAPPPTPGAPAAYVFGPEVTSAGQSALRDALDVGTRFIRASMGRELPSFSVWGYTDLESLIRVYAETAPTEQANARDIWTRGTVAVASYRKAWFGPAWFADSTSNRTKIAVHETFHILQIDQAGDRTFNSGFDDIPRAGPRWISEGSAELVGYLAIADARLTSMSTVRGDWVQRARSSPVTLQRLALLRGQFEAGPNAWGIMPLAVERLVGEGGAAKVLTYFQAIGRGDPWEAAFAAAFGTSIEAFYADFATYRSGL
jgi:RTX calcium-binding nonapeptide repeat (4 copies)